MSMLRMNLQCIRRSSVYQTRRCKMSTTATCGGLPQQASSSNAASDTSGMCTTSISPSGVARIKFSNPRRNSLSLSCLRFLRTGLASLTPDNALLPPFKPELLGSKEHEWLWSSEAWLQKRKGAPRVIILETEGEVFCSGHDLKELNQLNKVEVKETFELCGEVMEMIRHNPAIVIAKVQGLATAAGAQLASTCDLVAASSRANFATPGVNIGLYCTTPAIGLSPRLDSMTLFRMLSTGNPISAKDALNHGLVSHLINDHETLSDETDLIAEEVAAKPAQVSALGKWAFWTQREGMPNASIGEKLKWGGKLMVAGAAGADCREGMDAFINKRKPEWVT